jgi:hypothetical protein
VLLKATSGLNAVVAVFRERRAQIREVGCRPTDASGRMKLAIWGKRGDVLRIAVGRRPNSVAGPFHLSAVQAELPARPPGKPLPHAGMRPSVDAFLDVDDAWSVVLRSGVSYRINLVPRKRTDCISAYLYRPHAQSFDEKDAVLHLECRGYALFTPGPDGGGRYTLHLEAGPDVQGPQHYRLQVARAGRDGSAPGIAPSSGAVVDGSLFGRGIDVVDLYQFTVSKPSMFATLLATSPNVAGGSSTASSSPTSAATAAPSPAGCPVDGAVARPRALHGHERGEHES